MCHSTPKYPPKEKHANKRIWENCLSFYKFYYYDYYFGALDWPAVLIHAKKSSHNISSPEPFVMAKSRNKLNDSELIDWQWLVENENVVSTQKSNNFTFFHLDFRDRVST